MTQAGMVLGTAAYMSPEQAKGRVADRRADIWAFGVVLFEMLSGRAPFVGETVAEVLAAVITHEPDFDALPSTTPPRMRDLVRRCLRKNPKQRVRDIGDARLEIEATVDGDDKQATASVAPATLRFLPWGVAAAALVIGATTALSNWSPTPQSETMARLSVEIGVDASIVTEQGVATVLSPDGRALVFVAREAEAGQALYIRFLERLQATRLAGTDDARSPFFSPDSQWIGFFANGKLKKISVAGGAAVTLCDAPNGRGGAWAEDGTIAFLPNNGGGLGLWRVASEGGAPQPFTTLMPGEQDHRWPQILPGGRAVLFTTSSQAGSYNGANIAIQTLPNGTRKIVARGYGGRYLTSGHLVYIHDGTMFAAAFNLERLEVVGPAVPILTDVVADTNFGAAHFTVSDRGTAAYLAVSNTGAGEAVLWVDRNGTTSTLRDTPADWSNIHISPDARYLAMDISDGRQTDVAVYDWSRDTITRLTLDAAEDWGPVWSPDSRLIAFRSSREGPYNLYWQRADGVGEASRLTNSRNTQYPVSWHPSGKFLAFVEITPDNAEDVMILPIGDDVNSGFKPGTPTALLNSSFNESSPAFSPDGDWIAYTSNSSGTQEVYVRPFPGPGSPRLISNGGGEHPAWSRARPEILYQAPNGQIIVSPYSLSADSFKVDRSRPWPGPRVNRRRRGSGAAGGRPFDLHPDGARIAGAFTVKPKSDETQERIVFLFNFFDEVRRLAVASK